MEVNLNKISYRLPDFLIVGAAKSGTTALFYYLSQHHQIIMSSIKEPNFFCFYNQQPAYKVITKNGYENFSYNQYAYDIDHYCALFNSKIDQQIFGEASTNYLYDYKETIKNIKKIYGALARQLKIIIILRNPIERAWSHYSFHKRNGRENLNFDEAVNRNTIKKRSNAGLAFNWDYIGFGEYGDQISAYLSNFENVHILLFDDFVNERTASMEQIFRFLGVPSDRSIDTSLAYNVSGRPKNKFSSFISKLVYEPNFLARLIKRTFPDNWLPPIKRMRYRFSNKLFVKETMNENQRHYLNNLYQKEIQCLAAALDRDLSDWVES